MSLSLDIFTQGPIMRAHILVSLFLVSCCTVLPLQGQTTFAGQSVLASGEWYKIGVVETGMYRLDRTFLENLGLNTAAMDPRNIRLFGNGGGMLPQSNDAWRPDDLIENAIEVVGESDGRLDAGDQVIFYGQGPDVVKFDPASGLLVHQKHLYADTNFYYLQIGDQPGKRVATPPAPLEPELTLDLGHGFYAHEQELDNPLGGSGRYWLGELFDVINERDYAFDMADRSAGGDVRLSVRVAARASSTTFFRIYQGENLIGSVSLRGTNTGSETADHYVSKEATFSLAADSFSGDSLSLTLRYEKQGNPRAEGWLDWIEIEYEHRLDPHNTAFYPFYLKGGESVRRPAQVSLRNAGGYELWEVTAPWNAQRMALVEAGNGRAFTTILDPMKAYVAFKEGLLRPVSGRRIANQNLHGMSPVEYLMIAHQDFLGEAERLAQFHRDHYGRTVSVVTPAQIYQEFSSGKTDVAAIRDFIRMMYVRSAGQYPQYVLLFGDGSYDPKNIRQREEPGNFVPTYQSRNSWTPPESYTSDDFFVLLEESEGFWGERAVIDGDIQREVNDLDAGIGRLPVSTREEARQVVDKIIRYVTGSESLGDWRNRVVLVADHKPEDGNTHISQADSYTRLITGNNACMQVDKIFMDNYELVPTASRPSFPNGRGALLEALDEGSLIVNYTGHGGESAWSDASIFTTTDVQRMRNGGRLPVVVTATCEFGRFDNPGLRSGAEDMLLRPEGGAIALLTTVRLVYSGPNKTINDNFYREVFTFDSLHNRMPTLGEIMMRTKNRTFPQYDINSRNFTLLGDPGLILNYPTYRASITEINNRPIDLSLTDTLPSLSRVAIRGQIENAQGEPMPGYEGDLKITVFDKPSKFVTQQFGYTFYWQINKIFRGTASIEGGAFDFEFVVPIDVSYDEGQGKVSLYFTNGTTDGAGCYANFFVGGTDTSIARDEEGPEVNLFLNDETWRDGGKTGATPLLIAQLKDESGINTVGSGIGHEIIGFLDEDDSNVWLLNDFYQAEKDDYTTGELRYELPEVAPGPHTLTLRVWDVANNPTEARTRFVVAENAEDALEAVLNIPNPLTEYTDFYVAHNQAGKNLRLSVEIYTMDGRKIVHLEERFLANANSFTGLRWDGTDESGAPLPQGVYLYHVTVVDEDSSSEVRKTSRLVLLRS